jgi:hypothetical protein
VVGVIWAKYGLWCKKALSLDENITAGQWIVFATVPDDLRRKMSRVLSLLTEVNAKKDSIMDDWKEPYHLGRGTGRFSTSISGATVL